MERRQNQIESLKSISGTALLTAGAVTLYHNLAAAIGSIMHSLAMNGSDSVGVVPALILTALRASHTASDDRGVILAVSRHLCASCWPAFLLIGGAVLARNILSENRGR